MSHTGLGNNFGPVNAIAKSLIDLFDPELGAYLVMKNPFYPEMRFNFPAIIYFHDELLICASYTSGEAVHIEYDNPEVFPSLVIQKITSFRSQISDMLQKSKEFPSSDFDEDYLDYITKNIL